MTYKKMTTGNEILDDKESGFFISFRSGTNSLAFPGFEADDNLDETALVIPNDDTKYRTLNGDFRKAYEAVYPDKTKCLAIFEANQDKESSWSGK